MNNSPNSELTTSNYERTISFFDSSLGSRYSFAEDFKDDAAALRIDMPTYSTKDKIIH